jgi:hypothetical protein
MGSQVEAIYRERASKYRSLLALDVGQADAEDVFHNAVEVALLRERDGKKTSWLVLLRFYRNREFARRAPIEVGLDVRSLADAIDVADICEGNRAAALAQRVLKSDELMVLLEDYTRQPSRDCRIKIRLARKKLKQAWSSR